MEDNEGSYQAIVEKVILGGKHGAYAVARCAALGLVTFSLDKPVWQEKKHPEPGTYVMLSELRKKRAGWRAEHGRFVKPSDPETSN
jgi:hypothetical protein